MIALGAVLAMTGGTVGLALFVGSVVIIRRARRTVARANDVLRAAQRERQRAEAIHANGRPTVTQAPRGTYPVFLSRVPVGRA